MVAAAQEFNMTDRIKILQQEAIDLLRALIATPSFSREESDTAALIGKFLAERQVAASRVGNNILALSKHFNDNKPTLLLNSHHDTVRPNPQYSRFFQRNKSATLHSRRKVNEPTPVQWYRRLY